MRIEQKKVLVGKDWGLFKTFNYNRIVDEKRVEKLMSSISKTNIVTAILCVFIDGFYYIIDGQTRFNACKRLNRDIVVELVENITSVPDIMSELNRNNKAWRTIDYFNMWTILGKEGFIEIKKIMDEYDLSFNQINIFMNKRNNDVVSGFVSSDFKNENYKISGDKKKYVIKCATYLQEILNIDAGYIEQRNNNNLKSALCKIITMYNYNHSRMIDVCRKMIMLPGKRQVDYFNIIVEEYNKNLRDEHRLSSRVLALKSV